MDKVYDIIVLGAGPAGLAAASYAGRARMDTLLIEGTKDGGQIVITNEIENYPGSLEEESGPSLIARMTKQVEKFGADRVTDTIVDVELEGKVKHLKGNHGDYYAKAVVIATGASPRPIGCPGEKEFTGKGVSYCATCDANFFEDFEVYVVGGGDVIATGASPRPIGCPGEKEFTGKGVSYCATCDANFFEDFEVYVVGGGDSAVEEAMYLTKFARKVTLVHRRDELRAAKSIQEKAFANPKMAFMWNTTIEEIKGDGVVTSMIVKDTKTGETREIEADEEDGTFGIFVFVGFDPKSQLFEGKLEMENRYIVTDKYMHTSVPGVFAAGDVIVKHLRQVVTACGDGAVAATEAQHYVENLAD